MIRGNTLGCCLGSDTFTRNATVGTDRHRANENDGIDKVERTRVFMGTYASSSVEIG